AEAGRSRSEQRLEVALACAEVGLWDWDLRDDSVVYGAGFLALLGHRPGDAFPGRIETWEGAIHPDDIEGVMWKLEAHLRGESATLEVEHRLRTRDGGWRW